MFSSPVQKHKKSTSHQGVNFSIQIQCFVLKDFCVMGMALSDKLSCKTSRSCLLCSFASGSQFLKNVI